MRYGVAPFRIEIMTTIDGVQFGGAAIVPSRSNIEDLRIPVIGLADLKINKKASGPHQDLADLERLP